MAKINPNRMELLKLKRRLQMARRGHKLLKDKLEELLRRFLLLIDELLELRGLAEKELAEAFAVLAQARGEAGTLVVSEALAAEGPPFEIGVKRTNILSVSVPSFKLPESLAKITYSLATTPAVLDVAVGDFAALLRKLVRLAELEKTVQLLAAEIDKTRRRVNALEYILIPQLETTIKQINMSLAEQERANLTRVMKIKEMIEARQQTTAS